jgi:hypothetical protein
MLPSHMTKALSHPAHKVHSASKPEDHSRQGLVVMTLNVQNGVFRQRLGARSAYCLPPENGAEHTGVSLLRQPLKAGKLRYLCSQVRKITAGSTDSQIAPITPQPCPLATP